MQRVIKGKRYDTKTAKCIAHNNEYLGRASYLFKTQKGNFFVLHETCWQGEYDMIEPIDLGSAKQLYEELEERQVEYEVAFGVAPEEA